MTARLRPEDIYDAALDDAAFAALPGLVARALGARSAVLHWQNERASDLGELRHSQYFDEAQLAALDGELADADLWAEAVRRARGRAWCCDDLVDAAEFAHSRIYNDWILAMGDDSFHAMGAVFDGGGGITAEIGMHRSRSSGAFDARAVATLQSSLRAFTGMVAMRARLAIADKRTATVEAALDGSSDAMFVLDERGRPLHANRAAERLLEDADVVSARGGALHGRDAGGDRDLQSALRVAGARDGAHGSSLTLRHDDDQRYAVTLLPAAVHGHRRIVAVMTPRTRSGDRAWQLSALYGLSAAEMEVAVMLADGHAPAEIAERRGARIATIRSQIKAILVKVDGTRQGDIVAAVHALPRVAGSPAA